MNLFTTLDLCKGSEDEYLHSIMGLCRGSEREVWQELSVCCMGGWLLSLGLRVFGC